MYFLIMSFVLSKDINFYLDRNDAVLWEFYTQVKRQFPNHPTFGNRILIAQKNYENLSKEEQRAFEHQVVFVALLLQSKPVYNDFGGVSVRGILAEDQGDRRAKNYWYQFDGRYYTDLAMIKEKRIYAYCKLPRFNHCILLGIHEEW